ncbi:hypothetical protein JCM4814A_01330 [Streptomyces phaeofaciens JCM 4814]|uniref:Uncharacterized protein n=1 Tax=Streptomyces phaeofaciens TaxID=68254 RepID=A0A918HQR3_9ACTN|nr:hypothetical protein [Streptomyces phaeofaciens]GGT94347.1 hypothetical protein GCM10010226_85160 [Streptomyces phaeofaciens]
MSDHAIPEEPDLFWIRKLSPILSALSGLALVEAADLTGVISDGSQQGWRRPGLPLGPC